MTARPPSPMSRQPVEESAAGEPVVAAKVDRSRCVGAGFCVATAPEDFELDDDGRSRPLRTEAPGSAAEGLVEAADLCPVEAITVFHARTGHRLAP
ncbi:ferredoxin [Streptomyces sp. NPDC092296]|uniref:ferredoxin n=1 Tax=Streptomyces sp. NPDC092296 TaxID=3366012 RepID=UPI00382D8750